MTEYLGWLATAVFAGSYFFKRQDTLRHVQMGGATIWIAYGTLIGAAPVIAANLLVLAAAAWTLARRRSAERGPATFRRRAGECPESEFIT